MLRLLLATVCLVWVWPSDARACSCVGASYDRTVTPTGGADDVPRDVTIRIFTEGFGDALRDVLGAEYRLRPEGGRPVPLRTDVVGTRIDRKPRRRLRPRATYVIEQLFAFGPNGERLSDGQRVAAARRQAALRGAWFPIARFRTGSGNTPRRRATPTLQGAEVHFRFGGGDCGPATSIHATVEASGPPGDVLELELRGQGVVATVPVSQRELWVGDALCNPDPVTLQYTPSSEVRLVHRDRSGREVGASAWQRPSRPARGRLPSRLRTNPAPHRSHHSAPAAFVRAWRDLDIVQPTGAGPSGPPGCENGFEVTNRHEVASHHAPWAYGARSTLSTVDNGSGGHTEHWLAFGGDDTRPSALVRVIGGRVDSRSIQRTLWPADLIAGLAGPWVVAGTGHGQTSVFSLHRPGGARWERALPHDGQAHRIARGGGRILAAWGATGQPISRRFLSWMVLDDITGEPVAPAVRSPYELETGTTEGPAIATLTDRFLVAWTSAAGLRAGPSYVMPIGFDGQQQPKVEVALTGQGIPDMTGAGTHAAFVNGDRSGQIRFFLLDGGGSIVHGPATVSIGVGQANRLPRVAYDGELFAVGWEVHPGGGVYVAAVAPDGRASAATRVDRPSEEHAGTVGVAPTDGGFALSYTHHRGQAALVELRCRGGAPSGPPARIAPAP